jgi:hypothetical protein
MVRRSAPYSVSAAASVVPPGGGQLADEQRRGGVPKFQRPGQPEQVVVVLGDQIQVAPSLPGSGRCCYGESEASVQFSYQAAGRVPG